MKRLFCVVIVGLAATFSAVPSMAQTAECSQAQPVVTGLLESVSKRLEAARLTNSAPAMRDAAADVQAALLDVRRQLTPCAQMETAPGNPHTGHAMPGMVPPPPQTPQAPPAPQAPKAPPGARAPAVDPHAGHVMPSTPPPAPAAASPARTARPMPPTTIAALRCAAPVDPKTAPRMMYQGQMYYFCSEQERAAFTKNPGTPAPAPAPGNAPAHAH